MITIAIAEDHQSLIDGIKLLLKYEPEVSIVGMANDGEELLHIVKTKRPNVVITDIKMPKIDGILVTKIIKKEYPNTKVIGFSMFDQDHIVKDMIRAGCDGYLLKNSPLEELLKAIYSVNNKVPYFDSAIDIAYLKNESNQSKKDFVLTKSEREILKLIAEGKTSSEIADIRFTAVSTVEKHRKNMMHKLELKGKNELLRYALDKKYE